LRKHALVSSAWVRSLLLAALVASAGRASAQPSGEPRAASSDQDQALATALFREGRALMVAGRFAEACPKLAESQRLDPGGGTILNLALCHEQEGHLARSWSEFNEAIAFARRDRRADREAEAAEHVAQLEPRLSRLTIVVPGAARTSGLRVELDGRALEPASWSLAIPLDAGEHVVGASAPGHAPFTTTVSVAGEGRQETLEIPVLRAATPPAPQPRLEPTQAQQPSPVLVGQSAPAAARSLRRPLGWVASAAGVAQVGAAAYFGIRALQLHGRMDDAAAGPVADASTVLTATGLVTLAGGIYLLATSGGF
jgi:hypothetical protein